MRKYKFYNKEIIVEGYLSGEEIKTNEAAYGPLLYVEHRGVKVPCLYAPYKGR